MFEIQRGANESQALDDQVQRFVPGKQCRVVEHGAMLDRQPGKPIKLDCRVVHRCRGGDTEHGLGRRGQTARRRGGSDLHPPAGGVLRVIAGLGPEEITQMGTVPGYVTVVLHRHQRCGFRAVDAVLAATLGIGDLFIGPQFSDVGERNPTVVTARQARLDRRHLHGPVIGRLAGNDMRPRISQPHPPGIRRIVNNGRVGKPAEAARVGRWRVTADRQHGAVAAARAVRIRGFRQCAAACTQQGQCHQTACNGCGHGFSTRGRDGHSS